MTTPLLEEARKLAGEVLNIDPPLVKISVVKRYAEALSRIQDRAWDRIQEATSDEALSMAMAKQAVEVLNRALEADPHAITFLMKQRVVCNMTLAKDPTIQVAKGNITYSMSALGVINGIVGIREDGWGYVAAHFALGCPAHGKNEVGKLVEGDVCPVGQCKNTMRLGLIECFKVIEGPPVATPGDE